MGRLELIFSIFFVCKLFNFYREVTSFREKLTSVSNKQRKKGPLSYVDTNKNISAIKSFEFSIVRVYYTKNFDS